MNVLIKIFGKVVHSLSKFSGGMDKKKSDSTRKVFIFLFALFIISALLLGRSMGKKSARKKTFPLITKTNDTFSITIDKNKSTSYRVVAKDDSLSNSKLKQLEKIDIPGEDSSTKKSERIVEPEKTKKKSKSIKLYNPDFIIEDKTKLNKKEALGMIKGTKSQFESSSNIPKKRYNNIETSKKRNDKVIESDKKLKKNKILYKSRKSVSTIKDNKGVLD